MAGIIIRGLSADASAPVLSLYRAVAAAPGSGLARTPEEISQGYVDACLGRAGAGGIVLGAFLDEQLIGVIHAAHMQPRQFSHVLTDLTVAVHPQCQGRRVGTRLFEALFDAAGTLDPAVTRIELVARSGNTGALQLYERLGFVREGRFKGRVKLPGGVVEDDIPMARLL